MKVDKIIVYYLVLLSVEGVWSVLRSKKKVAEYPLLVSQWSSKNESSPDNTYGSSLSDVIWVCNKGHEWNSSPRKRLRGGASSSGCTVCHGRKVVEGVNDLASQFPEIAGLWDFSRNLDCLPTEVTAYSKKLVYWKCDYGHEWKTSVSNHSKCSKCALPKFYEIAEKFWDTDNNNLNFQEAKRDNVVFLKCGLGHKWSEKMYNVSICYKCENISPKHLVSGINDAATVKPWLSGMWSEMNDESPDKYSYGSRKDVFLVGDCGHTWNTPVKSASPKCHYCIGRKILKGFNDLKTLYPEIAELWDYEKNKLEPQDFTRQSSEKVWWRCSDGHSTMTTIAHKVNGTKCPICSNRILVVGNNDLLTVHPEIAEEWDIDLNISDPSSIVYGSAIRANWICSKGHVWSAKISDRVFHKSECPSCPVQVSKPEQELIDIVQKLCPNVKTFDRSVLNGKELDIYVPDKNFAIEFNGVYWHTEAKGKDANYHYSKFNECLEKGIYLYQVWSDDWSNPVRRSAIVRGIAHRIGGYEKISEILPHLPHYVKGSIGARKTKVKKLNYIEAKTFLDSNHIQGSCIGSAYYGLIDSDSNLRAVMVMRKTNKTGEYYLDRYATAGNVQGGFTKLLQIVKKDLKAKKIITFSDNSISNGGLYERNGFTVDKILPPDYSYFVKGERIHKFNYRIKRFKDDPQLIYNEGMSEKDLAILNNLPRVWDSGKVRWVLS